jgi:signal transduction histidine kinase
LVTISHELRTPLTAIRSAVGLLLDPKLPAEDGTRQRLLETIAASADRMQRLVADVLDLRRFRAGAMPLQRRRFDAVALTRESAAAVEPQLTSRSQRLEVTVPEAPVWIYADHRRLEQVILNLLANAHNFSAQGTTIHLTLLVEGQDIVWRVADHGVGIPSADLPRLFERFFSAPTDAAGPHSGTGLGLPLALAIAQAHGGTIEVESEVGRGSVFTLRVPAKAPADQEDDE